MRNSRQRLLLKYPARVPVTARVWPTQRVRTALLGHKRRISWYPGYTSAMGLEDYRRTVGQALRMWSRLSKDIRATGNTWQDPNTLPIGMVVKAARDAYRRPHEELEAFGKCLGTTNLPHTTRGGTMERVTGTIVDRLHYVPLQGRLALFTGNRTRTVVRKGRLVVD